MLVRLRPGTGLARGEPSGARLRAGRGAERFAAQRELPANVRVTEMASCILSRTGERSGHGFSDD